MSLQVCHCGWSKVTSYQGLRTHQGKMGCTSRGMRIPESSFLPGFTGFTFAEAPITFNMANIFTSHVDSDLSLQVCPCGWNKETTHQGLRTHQGMMGCTKKGMRIPQSRDLPQITSTKTPITTIPPDDKNLLVCHCGWNKETTHHGLRTHQGLMGCTKKGMRILQNRDIPQITSTKTPITTIPDNKHLLVCPCGWNKETTHHGLMIHQGMMGCLSRSSMEAVVNFNTRPVKVLPTFPVKSVSVKKETPVKREANPQPLFAPPLPPLTTDVKVLDTNQLFFGTPPPPAQQSNGNSYRIRRALDFNTSAHQFHELFQLHTKETAQRHNHFDERRVSTPSMMSGQELGADSQSEESELEESESEESESEESESDDQNTGKTEKQREAENALLHAKQESKRAELQQKIQVRERKMAEARLAAKSCTVSLDAEWLEINEAFAKVMSAVAESRQEALRPLEERRLKAEREEKKLVQKLEGEIEQIKNLIVELDADPHLQFSPDQSSDQEKGSVDTSFSFGSLRTTTSAMMERIQRELEELSSVELKRVSKFAVDVRLDPASAHPCLHLSDDGKEVRDGGKRTTVADSAQRFDLYGSILALNRLTSGRAYWEVEVGPKTGWEVGVARGDANRKGKLSLTPEDGYWATVHFQGKGFAALTAPPTSLALSRKPKKVGVFVDYEEALVSVYDVTARSHVYSFTECVFGGEIFPYFSPHLQDGSRNAEPLILLDVEGPK